MLRNAFTLPLVGVLLLLLFATTAPASALELGVVFQAGDRDRIEEVARRADAMTTLFGWNLAQRSLKQYTSGKYDWSRHDLTVRQAANAGTPLLARLHGMPEFAACNFAGYPTPAFMVGYLQFVERVVKRYGPGGRFWETNPAVPNNPITEWQVHNEPDLPSNWCGTTDPVGYGLYFVTVAQRIHATDPNATVVMGGMDGQARRADWAYVRAVLGQPLVQAEADRLAVHPYAGPASNVIGLVQGFREALDSQGYTKPIMVTEWGWVTGSNRTEHKLFTTEAGQKTKLEISIADMRLHAEALQLDKALIFSAYDKRNPDPTKPFDFAGLYRADGTAKPAAEVLPR
jgi:hypothetical protein